MINIIYSENLGLVQDGRQFLLGEQKIIREQREFDILRNLA